MVYGFTFDEIKRVNHPGADKKPWGHYIIAASRPEYSLTQIYLKKGAVQPLHYHLKNGGAFFVEEGAVLIKGRNKKGELTALKLNKGETFRLAHGLVHALCGLEGSYVYLFAGKYDKDDYYPVESEEEAEKLKIAPDKIRASNSDDGFKAEKTFDYRDKYWGSIQTVVNDDYAGKRIHLLAGAQNSLEFHCRKIETYFVHSGSLKVGLRIGHGENKSVTLKAGDAFDILPGLMHMKVGIEDSVIIEISTPDDDRDSHLVEDGRKYRHLEN